MILSTPHARPRRAPLAAALLAACGAAAATPPLEADLPAGWVPGAGRGVAALMQALADRHQMRGPGAAGTAATRVVTSCADDGGPGTLRAAVAAANNDDVIDLSQLQCSVVTLTQGAVKIDVDSLTLHGPGAPALALDGGAADRVLVHYGTGRLLLDALTVRNGLERLAGYKVAGGACIVGNGTVTLDHVVVRDCVAIGEGAYGGGIITRGLTMYTSTLVNNVAQGSLLATLTAAYGGGAFAFHGTAALYDCTVSGNRATIDPGNSHGSYDTGAGVFTDGGGIALRSTFSGNSTDGTGAAIASHGGFVIGNSTISGNSAGRAGGGVFVRPIYPVSIYNSTITANQASTGAGLYLDGNGEQVTLQSTILSGNSASTGAADLDAPAPQTVYGANNLIGVAGSAVTVPNDTLHGAPMLLPLANNGGLTQTHALAAASPAIDRGNNAANLATDQRGAGFPRVQGPAPDIGAFETAPAAPAVVVPAPALPPWTLALLAGLLGLSGLRRSRKR